MPRTYVDNAMNRSLGRVGMAHGTAVHSSSSSSRSSSASPRTYVDNSFNRSHGRVGVEVGSAVISRTSSSNSSRNSSASPRTYVDNSFNRSHGRVGVEVGSAVISRSSSANSTRSSSATPRTYVDNSFNRSHGRVGVEVGSAVISRSSSANSTRSSSATPRTYVDNSYNRSHGRVGHPLGTLPISRNSTSNSSSPRTYVDNSYNRSLGRVGKPLGSMVVSSSSSAKAKAQKFHQDILDNGKYDQRDLEENYDADFVQTIQEMIERMRVWESVKNEKQSKQTVIRRSALESYVGQVIEFDEIQIGEKIGHGGFGDVFSAQWHGNEVAVKKLRVQRVSRKRLNQFEDEINIFSKLDHKNIVKFYGASVKTPNICMVMELMSDSLYDIIHFKQVQISDENKYFIMKEIAHGLNYLHSKGVAHCDIKSTNVLVNVFENDHFVVKLTDFGISLMKNDTETTTSKHQFVGTPRYSAPEILRGELLSKKDMEKTDIYSYGLVMFEIVCEEEPFDGLNLHQLRKQVGECGLTPPLDLVENAAVKNLLRRCWIRQPKQRPRAIDIIEVLRLVAQ